MQINTSRTVYGILEQSTEDESYDSLRDSFLSDINESRAEDVEYEEDFRGDEVTITITATDFMSGSDSSISITEEDGALIYEDDTFLNETAEQQPGDSSEISQSITAGLAVDYYLTMPGEIVESNADTVEGNTAEWHESGEDAFIDDRIYARSELPTGVSLPGFGVLGVLSALLLLALFSLVRNRD